MSASTITVKQQSFVRSLLEERLDALGITLDGEDVVLQVHAFIAVSDLGGCFNFY